MDVLICPRFEGGDVPSNDANNFLPLAPAVSGSPPPVPGFLSTALLFSTGCNCGLTYGTTVSKNIEMIAFSKAIEPILRKY